MSKSKVPHQKIPTEERELTDLPSTSNPTTDDEDSEEEKFDAEFWKEVVNSVNMFCLILICYSSIEIRKTFT